MIQVIEIIFGYDELFQDPKGFPPKREIEHEINLKLYASLPNIGMYRS